ncbi:FAD-dependent monooxygenase [Streptomyces sp. NPDC093060]|uniref:FAD-dependent monooxygenase n=1 Tax=Streptomyces sp. NPDC093060 TaxID=3366019 RepID=UPI003825239A
MAVANAEVEVLIVGGGPVGLTARALLERWGVRVLLVEKHAELSPFPRSRLVNVRSMEICRQLGLADRIAAKAFGPEYGRVRFRDTLHDRGFATAAMVGVDAPVPESPVIGVVTSQDRLEPTLLAAADTEVRFGFELVGLAELCDGDTDYVPTAEPGHRMPHFWLAPGRSTLDALGAWFTLLTPDPTHWAQHTDARWPLRVETLPKEHADLCGIHPQGALLIRPDGHIGARWQDRPSTDGTLHQALASITCSAPS